MAIRFTNKVGTMTVTQGKGENERKFKVSIWTGNCLAVFNYSYKDERIGKDMYGLYMFFMDKKHCANIYKNHGNLFGEKVSGIRINCAEYGAKEIADVLIKYGYQVTCYSKPKKKK